jgi:hypothetical protein
LCNGTYSLHDDNHDTNHNHNSSHNHYYNHETYFDNARNGDPALHKQFRHVSGSLGLPPVLPL